MYMARPQCDTSLVEFEKKNVETQYLMHEVWKWLCNNDRQNYSNNTHMRSKEGTFENKKKGQNSYYDWVWW